TRGLRYGEVLFRDSAQLRDGIRSTSRVAVARQIDEMNAPASRAAGTAVKIEPVQVREPRLAGCRARARQGALLRERIDKRRLSDVRPADERDVRHAVARYAFSAHRAGDEPGCP